MYGLVLEGGGAKGSYHIGACKALKELNIEFAAVAGTSVGALNGAMIVQNQLDKAYEIWYNITPSQIFDLEEEGLKKAWSILQNKGMDISAIKKLLQEIIDEQKLRSSAMDFGFVTVSLTDRKPLELFLEDIPQGKVVEYLLASAYLPAFKQEKLDGKWFMDGGIYDNLPLNMLVKKGYKKIIAVRTKALGRTRKVTDPQVTVDYISTDDNLGGILDFSQNQARLNLQLGYYDVFKYFKGLKGRKYYIEPTYNEELFFNLLLAPGEKTILRLGEILGFKGFPYLRLLFEHLIPKLTLFLDLDKESSYEDLVIAMLEIIATESNVERFKIYSLREFFSAIKLNIKNADKKDMLLGSLEQRPPAFILQSDVLSRAVKDKIVKELAIEFFYEFLMKTELNP
ncbi:MAG: patatin-like phospholipase family protein [Peptococcaceae bacterium]|jgi:NTE family protein|nr:patatin-like phospholipase family protein [Peptococcaceae bacterium]